MRTVKTPINTALKTGTCIFLSGRQLHFNTVVKGENYAIGRKDALFIDKTLK